MTGRRGRPSGEARPIAAQNRSQQAIAEHRLHKTVSTRVMDCDGVTRLVGVGKRRDLRGGRRSAEGAQP